ncbi:polyamine-transporting ATPase 13A2 [Dendroctonus ponderosae]|uniref:polyamine-transporting ATPase 13A2 n=1 Tax=Dendroctonus ponderosae TaxID=77166 RepID=UPI0020363EEE|nr:polyamine-transporting ATPase 13A2 [Dendroctonus ponderosae]
MTVGKLFALNRLKLSKIFCINSRVINVSGSVDCVCFDKTGTLTEDTMDLWGVVPIAHAQIQPAVHNIRALPSCGALLRCLATCHSLTVLEGRIAGDPLDVKMFESTGWVLEDNHRLITVRPPANAQQQIAIVKQFQFASALQRMCVIVRSPQQPNFEVFCKGSPEKILSLCRPQSVPMEIHAKLREHTAQGYRVIGLATKQVGMDWGGVAHQPRDALEAELTFLGLLVLENRLKPQTARVIQTLKQAQLKVVMITGDNVQTAVTVARGCHIIDPSWTVVEIVAQPPTKQAPPTVGYHVMATPTAPPVCRDVERGADRKCYVITGPAYATVAKHFPELMAKLMALGAVFARMTGAQKQHVVEQLKSLGYYVAMCGDGANDCGALKAAHVGISLSEAESSVASPFTSQEANISCAPQVIQEGRAALVTSFGVFQMMLCYSLTEFTSVIILYGIDSNLSSFQFLFIDICLILNFAATFGRTRAHTRLAHQPPRTSLLSFVPICSMALFMLLAAGAQTFSFHYIQTFDWFVPFQYDPSAGGIAAFTPSYENYAVFCTSMFQYVTMAVTFSKGKPYRRPIWTNRVFLACLVGMTGACAYLTLSPAQWLAGEMELAMPPRMDGRLMCLYVAAVTFLLCYFVQCCLVEVLLEQLATRWGNAAKPRRNQLENGVQNHAFIMQAQ